MEEGKKKLVMVIVVIVCLGVAGAITVMTKSESTGTLEELDPSEMIWVKCSNDGCEAEYQVGKKEYYVYMRDNRDPMSMLPPPMVCKECGEESVLQAVKCESCGLVFFKGSVPHDFADRCPECKYSAVEEARKARSRK